MLATDRPHALRQAIQAAARAARSRSPASTAGCSTSSRSGAAFAKGLTFKMGQTHVQNVHAAAARADPERRDRPELRHHAPPQARRRAAQAYKTFRNHQDDCIKVGAESESSEAAVNKWLVGVAAGVGAAVAAQAPCAAKTMTRLQGQVALITGGSRGLGLSLAREFARRGLPHRHLRPRCGRVGRREARPGAPRRGGADRRLRRRRPRPGRSA